MMFELEDVTLTEKEAAKKAYELMQEIPRDKRGNPLTLDGCIRSIILKNPDMSPYRDSALGILYTILGAGINWINGRLGDSCPNNYMNLPPDIGGQNPWSYNFGLHDALERICGKESNTYKEFKKKWELDSQIRINKIIFTIENIDARCQQYNPKPSNWYPMSWYASRLCAPLDAQQDFVDGAIETCLLIIDYEPTPCSKQWLDHQRTKKHAEDVLTILKGRVLTE